MAHESVLKRRDVVRAEHLPDGAALADIEVLADRLQSRSDRG